MTTNGYFDVFCFIFGAIWCVFLAKTTYYVSKMQCFFEENQAIYTKCTNHLYQMHQSSIPTKRTNYQTTDTNYLYHKYKPFVSEVQSICTGSTNPLYY